MFALDDKTTQVAARAFDIAWAEVVAECGAEQADIDGARELLAQQVLNLAEAGEADEGRLARAALLRFRAQRRTTGTAAPSASAGSPGGTCG